MQKVKFSAVVCAVTLLGLSMFSCNNENEYDYTNQTSQQVMYKQSTIPANEKNVYDSAGVIHNKVINEVMNDLRDKYGTVNKLNRIDVYEVLGTRLVNDGFFSSMEKFRTEVPISTLNEILNDTTNFYEKAIARLNVSLEAKEFVVRLFSTLEKYSEETDDYSIYRREIINIENDIIASQSLKTSEKEKLLKAMSIARYSLYYWFNFETSTLKAKRPIWKYLVVGGADILGGVIGSTATGISASALAVTIVDWNEKPEVENPKPEVPDSTTNKQ